MPLHYTRLFPTPQTPRSTRHQGPQRHLQPSTHNQQHHQHLESCQIIPILKPIKSPTEIVSYRPISLLCNPSKILERLVLYNITVHINLSPSQHGFRSQYSTSTLLTNLTQTIPEGLNSQKPACRSLLAAIHTVPRHLVINKILNTHIHPNFKK